MPVIKVTMGPTTEENKKKLVENLTREAMAVTQLGAEHFIVFIEELPVENIGLGGKTVKEIRGL